MNKTASTVINKLIKISALLLVIFPVIFFLNTGFSIDPYWKTIQAVTFSLASCFVLIWPNFRKYIFFISLFLIIIMAIFYIFKLIEWSEIIGSTGIGFVLINLISYLPQLLKKGYIEKI